MRVRRGTRFGCAAIDVGQRCAFLACGVYPEVFTHDKVARSGHAAGSWASEQSGCKVAAEHQRNRGGFLATEPTGIGLTESAQAKALP